jgi:hypothetical protein
MSEDILPIPPIPSGLREAAQRGTLIPFIGAGASRIAGCPSWSEFAFLDSYVPGYDFEDRLKSILNKLAQRGKRDDAIAFAEKLRHLPGMTQFYSNLCENNRGIN